MSWAKQFAASESSSETAIARVTQFVSPATEMVAVNVISTIQTAHQMCAMTMQTSQVKEEFWQRTSLPYVPRRRQKSSP